MSLTDPRILFGIHSYTPYDRITGKPYGILKVIGNAELSLAADSLDLFGGSNKFAVANEIGKINSQLTMEVKATPDFLFEKYIGASVSTVAASTTGTIGAIANKSGTSAVNATTGIASVGLKTSSEDDLKFGRYVVEVISATTVDVYVDTDIDFTAEGADTSYVNDLLKVTAAPITIPDTGATVDLTNFGLTFTGGSGSVAMTIGDTAIFDVAPPHSGKSEIVVGQSSIDFPEHGAILYAQRRADGSKYKIEMYKVKSSSGLVLPIPEGGFHIPSLTVKLLYDSAQDAVYKATALA